MNICLIFNYMFVLCVFSPMWYLYYCNICVAAGANCENAVECCVDRAPDEPMDVMCACGATFCFNCKEEAHRPVRAGQQ
jgi:hypothetical protein